MTCLFVWDGFIDQIQKFYLEFNKHIGGSTLIMDGFNAQYNTRSAYIKLTLLFN